MPPLKAASLALKLLLELCAFGAFAYWGGTVGTGAVPSSSRSRRRPSRSRCGRSSRPRSPSAGFRIARVPFELAVFGLAAAALLAAGHPRAAAVFATAAVVNAVLLEVWDQWEH